jgi:tRNA(fMet)-specific endonuclease VapC
LKYLLDTNVCIALINKWPIPVRAHFDKELRHGSEVYISSVAVFELWYGVSKSQRREMNSHLLVGFLSGPAQKLTFDDEDARFAGELRAEMDAIGRPIGQYDLLIAGQALRHKMTLVTANVREFSRVKALSWEDWSKA